MSSIDGTNLTTYAINVAKTIFTLNELEIGYINDTVGDKNQNKRYLKSKLPLDEDRVQVLKGRVIFRFYFIDLNSGQLDL